MSWSSASSSISSVARVFFFPSPLLEVVGRVFPDISATMVPLLVSGVTATGVCTRAPSLSLLFPLRGGPSPPSAAVLSRGFWYSVASCLGLEGMVAISKSGFSCVYKVK